MHALFEIPQPYFAVISVGPANGAIHVFLGVSVGRLNEHDAARELNALETIPLLP